MGKLNFRIVEGETPIDIDMEAFIHDYQYSNLNVKQLKKKYNLSAAEYNKIKKQLLQKGLRKGSTYSQGGLVYSNWGKNYNEHKGSWRVTKSINSELQYYGSYNTEEEAQKVATALREADWDKEQLPRILKELGISKRKRGRKCSNA